MDSKFIQCGSNSLKLLLEMKTDLENHNFENIRIKNTSLIGSNFVRCNLNGSEFDNVDISGMNVNGAQLFNGKWKNIKIHELNKVDGHSDTVNSVCFSPDGNILATGSGSNNWFQQSKDNSIRLWDVKTGQQKSKLDGHSSYVYSVCFSYPKHQYLIFEYLKKNLQFIKVQIYNQVIYFETKCKSKNDYYQNDYQSNQHQFLFFLQLCINNFLEFALFPYFIQENN